MSYWYENVELVQKENTFLECFYYIFFPQNLDCHTWDTFIMLYAKIKQIL